jgi:hypothetical protein
MRKVLSIIFSFTLFSVITAVGQVKVIKETTQESKVCNLILMLPVVRNADTYVKKVTKGKRHLFTSILSDPTKDDNYFYVKVAEDNGYSDHTHFIFLVDPKNYTIKYLDVATDKRIPLSQCSKKLLNDYRMGT